MAARFLTRSLALLATTKQCLPSAAAAHSGTAVILTGSSRPLFAASHFRRFVPALSSRGFATTNSLDEDEISLDGCDFEHWFVLMCEPLKLHGRLPTRNKIIQGYINTLARVLGCPEEARMKIYSVSTRHYFAFGARVSREVADKLKELPTVQWVLPDLYLDAENKDYGGEPFIDGQAVPYDPKYHAVWRRKAPKFEPLNLDFIGYFWGPRGCRRRRKMNNPGGGQPKMAQPPNAPNAGAMQQQPPPPTMPPIRGNDPPNNNISQGPPNYQPGLGPNQDNYPPANDQPGPGPNQGNYPYPNCQPGSGPNPEC